MKTKNKVLSIIPVLTLLLIQPLLTYAWTPVQGGYAFGSVDRYENAYSASIKSGAWVLTTTSSSVKFSYTYAELNIVQSIEQSPAGSTDYFYDTATNVVMGAVTPNSITFTCTIHVVKYWAKLDGTRQIVQWDNPGVTVTVVNHPIAGNQGLYIINPSTAYGEDWNTIGHTWYYGIHVTSP